jgi:hypothetical protein
VFVSDTKGTIVPKLISGALTRVPAGVNHRIDWEVLKDVGAFEGDLYAELSLIKILPFVDLEYSVLGRELLYSPYEGDMSPLPEDQSRLQGEVVLNVTVNLQGKVVQAELNTKKSSISRPDIVEKCKLSAREFLFSTANNQTAHPLQSGTIAFSFDYIVAEEIAVPSSGLTITVNGRKLEVADFDLPIHMNWDDAVRACQNLPDGWRLPDMDELLAMYEQLYKQGKGNFERTHYWSSSQYNSDWAWEVAFFYGEIRGAKSNPRPVRVVRDL